MKLDTESECNVSPKHLSEKTNANMRPNHVMSLNRKQSLLRLSNGDCKTKRQNKNMYNHLAALTSNKCSQKQTESSLSWHKMFQIHCIVRLPERILANQVIRKNTENINACFFIYFICEFIYFFIYLFYLLRFFQKILTNLLSIQESREYH